MNDTFEENAEKLVKFGKTEKEAWENKRRHIFFVPKQARWSNLSRVAENTRLPPSLVKQDYSQTRPRQDSEK